MRFSLQENGKRHGSQLQNVLSIKFHNKCWVDLDCQIIFMWSSTEQRTSDHIKIIWQSKTAQDLLWNLIFKTFFS